MGILYSNSLLSNARRSVYCVGSDVVARESKC